MEHTMTLREFLEQDIVVDVETSLLRWTVPFIGPLTKEEEEKFAPFLGNEITVDGCMAVLEVEDEEQDQAAFELFIGMFGICLRRAVHNEIA